MSDEKIDVQIQYTDPEAKKRMKEVARKIIKLIDGAQCCYVEANAEIDEAVNINTGLLEHAPTGVISFYFKLYDPERDKRAELHTRCGTRPGVEE